MSTQLTTLIGTERGGESLLKVARLSLALSSIVASALTLTIDSTLFAQLADAQATTLRDPLISGAPNSPAGTAPIPALPVEGSGSGAPPGVTPGMGGDPTLLPWVPNSPANTINQDDSQISLPVTPSVTSAPGMLGYSLIPFVPNPPSTPGADPGMLTTPPAGYPEPAAQVSVNTQGGLPDGAAPTTRRGGQDTQNFGRKNTKGSGLYDFGWRLPETPNLAATPQYSQDGPRVASYNGSVVSRAPNLPDAQDTTDLYGLRVLNYNNTQAQQIIAPY